MTHRNHRRATRNRKRNPSGLAIAGSLLALGVGGVVLRDILKKDSAPSKLPPGGGGGGPIVNPPVEPPRPTVSKFFLEVKLRVHNGGYWAGLSTPPPDVKISPGFNETEIAASSFPIDIVVSLADPALKSLDVLELSDDTTVVAGESGQSRDLIFRVTAPNDSSPAISLTTAYGAQPMSIDGLYIYVT